MPITIKDIALKAGVSKTAVSFAFNNPERISTETYEKIMSIAREEGYSPNPVARTLSNHKTKTIGMVLPQSVSVFFLNPYLSEILRGAGTVCDQEGYSISIMSPFKGIITQTILDAAVDGIIILGVSENSEVHNVLRQREMPYVTIDAPVSSKYVNVGIEDEKRAEELMTLLLSNEHRKIDICSLQSISPDLEKEETSGTLEARFNGIAKAIKQAHISKKEQNEFNYIKINAVLSDAYEEALKELKKPDRPTAVFCMADVQAYGFYKAASELGLSIPKDLSVVSFDDLPLSNALFPELTSVHQSGFEKGKAASKLLFKLIDGKKCESMTIKSEVIVRCSVASISK